MKLYKIIVNHNSKEIDLNIIKNPTEEELSKTNTMEVDIKTDTDILYLEAINKKEAYYLAFGCLLEMQQQIKSEQIYQEALYNGIKRG